MKLLLVEDDIHAADITSFVLKSTGATVKIVGTGEEALELVQQCEFDAVVLDILLPDMDGYDVLRAMRTRHISVPVLVLSGPTTAQARVKALHLGADGFVTKPVDGDELAAQIDAIARRRRGFSQHLLRVGELELNQDMRTVTVAGRPIGLTDKEYSILELLMLHKGRVLRRERFFRHLYNGRDEPESRTIDVFICSLRKKLLKAGDMITTIRGCGHMLRTSTPEPRDSDYTEGSQRIEQIAAAHLPHGKIGLRAPSP